MADYTTIDDPSAHFQVLTYTGNGSHPRNLTNTGNSDLKPDFIWLKNRGYTGTDHVLTNSSVGFDAPNSPSAGGQMASNSTGAENTPQATYGYISAALTDGFTASAGGTNGDTVNWNNYDFVAWQWKANGGTTSANTDGGINSTVQVNTTAGFSIITFTADGTTNTIGHGLGVKPDVVIYKSRGVAGGWLVITDVIDGSMDYGRLDQLSAFASIGYDANTSSVVQYNDNNTNTTLAFAFKEIQGYSKFGQYYGNAISDGPFVYCGFKPAWIMIKKTNENTNWEIFDTGRNPHNVADLKLGANLNVADNGSDLGTTSQNNIDIYSTGFKARTGNTDTNGDFNKFFYMAFAESPFVSSEGTPTTAR